MQSGFITLNNVPTRVATWGRWVEDNHQEDQLQEVLIFIPGNSGVSKSYEVFLTLLHEELGWPVWIVGHGGHEMPDNRDLYDIPEVEDRPELYTLNGQIQNKVDFFEKYVPETARVHLVGHSVGSYITTKLLKVPSIHKRVVKSYLLFPALEHISDTPNGKYMTAVLEPKYPLAVSLSSFFTVLPRFLQYFMVHVYRLVKRIPNYQTEMIKTFVDPMVLKRVFFMISDVLRTLKERETEVIKENIEKIKVYYGNNDDWSPKSYYEKLKQEVPTVDAEFGELGLDHAFCLRHSNEMGMLLVEWIKNC